MTVTYSSSPTGEVESMAGKHRRTAESPNGTYAVEAPKVGRKNILARIEDTIEKIRDRDEGK
jgi:hypothetical protein